MCAEKIDVVKKPKKQKQIQVQNLAWNKFTGGGISVEMLLFLFAAQLLMMLMQIIF